MAGLVPAIHALLGVRKTWMPATSAGMTARRRRNSKETWSSMKALFIGQSYIDVTFLADELPKGDDKSVARDYAISFGGNAVTAAFCCARLGIAPDLLASVADDYLGRMFI